MIPQIVKKLMAIYWRANQKSKRKIKKKFSNLTGQLVQFGNSAFRRETKESVFMHLSEKGL